MKRILTVILAVFTIVFLFTSCGKIGGYKSLDGEYSDSITETVDINKENSPEKIADSTSASQQKLIKEQYVYFETTDFDNFIKNINSEITKYSGYIQSSDIDGNQYYYTSSRTAQIVARIPADNYENFSKKISELGNVTEKRESTVDATASYIDIESRLKALKTEEETLLKILEDAQTTDDVITVNKRLSEVRYEIENYESNLRNLDNRINYCTVTIYANEVEKETEPLEDESMFKEIKNKFSDNLYNIGQDLRAVFVWFTSSILYIIIWAAVIAAVILIIKAIVKSKRKKK